MPGDQVKKKEQIYYTKDKRTQTYQEAEVKINC